MKLACCSRDISFARVHTESWHQARSRPGRGDGVWVMASTPGVARLSPGLGLAPGVSQGTSTLQSGGVERTHVDAPSYSKASSCHKGTESCVKGDLHELERNQHAAAV